MANNIRNILPNMSTLFNNSILTNTVANSLVEKLNEKEFRDLTEWLKHAKSKQHTEVNKIKRQWSLSNRY